MLAIPAKSIESKSLDGVLDRQPDCGSKLWIRNHLKTDDLQLEPTALDLEWIDYIAKI